MTKENAINFLLYNMLGVTVGDVCFDENCQETKDPDRDRDRIKAAIIRAYSDATMQGAYNTLFKGELKEKLKENSDSAKRKGGKLILEEIHEFFQDGSSSDKKYDEWHHDLCEKLKAKYENITDGNKKFFTYGNAQKWVNMTIKYLCLIDALSDGFIYHKRLCEFQSEFHIPVDSYIIEAVLPEEVYLPTSGKKRSFSNVKSWSTWDWDEDEKSSYKRFQKEIKEIRGSSPLDWENETWITQAEKRRLNENRSIRSKYKDSFWEEDECQ